MMSCDEQNSFKKSHMTLIWIGFDASSHTDISTISVPDTDLPIKIFFITDLTILIKLPD